MLGMEDLEDDIELVQPAELQVEQPRKLSRLRKGGAEKSPDNVGGVNGTDTPDGDARSSLAGAALLEDDEQSNDEEVEEEEDGPAASGGSQDKDYWDEEDEIEEYLQRRFEGAIEDEVEHSGSDSSDDEADGEYDAGPGALLGEDATLEDINAETQRILRETAARDRLGKGQKIEVKPLTGIVEKLKQRRALAVARAPKLRAEAAPSFDDVLAAAAERTPAKAPRPATNEGEAAEPGNAALEAGGSTPVPDVDAEADLELISVDDGDGGGADGFTVVDLPSAVKAAPKPSPLAFLPFTDSRELDEFEEEALIDDGAGLDDESDSESERSWEVRRADDAAEGEGAESKENQEKDAGGSGESDSEDDSDLDDEEDGEDGEESGAGMAVDGVDGEPAVHPTSDQGRTAATDLDATAKPPVPSAAVLLGAAQPVTKRAQRLQRAYLDTEAELSDEDAAAVSEDEADDDVDDRGELADLIATGKAAAVGAKEKDVAEMLHVQWAQQQDVKELQNVLKGLENGFRRRGGAGALADMDDDMDGRRRRARDMDDDLLLGGGLMWPSAFGALGGGNGGDDDDECEDEAMLQRAKQQRLLASSQAQSTSPLDAVPLDEDSQQVLGMLARSMSESQHAGPAPGMQQTSRLAMELLGTDPGSTLLRGPSFVGRQQTVARSQSTAALGLGGSRSFIFGRSENSNSAMGTDAGMPGSQKSGEEPTGPVSFANLKQLAGLAGGGVPAKCKKRGRGGATLLSRLRTNGSGACDSQEGVDAANAVYQQIQALGPKNGNRR